ncbi:LysM peptidoglycan-binding domain-containing protein [Vibrio quintilis]|uniref:LysM domain protein n=1 Tax=Vibrio quintilis TaxID=1117707 RepID=A0A1M7YSH6_9VIBR|nr:LysM domain-containing protein [Vibrio quintilis]SHO55570.1 LysM domain protein [Vibrio quintilis]
MPDNVHIVVRGETLTSIAKKHSVTTTTLLMLNPSLRKNPNHIIPGMAIIIRGTGNSLDPRISKMVFNGEKLNIYSISDRLVVSYSAISGLPPHAPHLAQLIAKGRKDLNVDVDYTQSKYQNVNGAGPIPEDTYKLKLKLNMPYDKSKAAGDGAGWGEGGWILTESLTGKLDNFFGGRYGFFLHHDGGAKGTSGCIGIRKAKDMKQLKALLSRAQMKGQQIVPIEVKYK